MFTGSSPTLGEVDIQLCWNMVNLVNSLSRKTQIELELSPGNVRDMILSFFHQFTFAWTTWMPPVNSCKWAHCMVADLLLHGAPSTWRQEIFRFFRKVQHDLSVFLGIWTSLGCNRWWWWSSIVTKRWGEALQYAIRSSAWSGPARFGNWDQVNEMMVRCMVWQLNYYFKTQNYMVWRSVNFGVCSLQFLFLCFRDCMLPWAAKRCSLHPHTQISNVANFAVSTAYSNSCWELFWKSETQLRNQSYFDSKNCEYLLYWL